jgi:hypothetical protein
MMENTTRISDLPDSAPNYTPTIPAAVETRQQNSAAMPTNYVPINVHPNPYGISTQNPIPPPGNSVPNPAASQQAPHYLSEEQKHQIQGMQQQRLPSRDIPRETLEYTQDEEIQANYIPKRAVSKDYVREYEDMTERNLREYEGKKKAMNSANEFTDRMQIPLLIAILYLIFQLPIVNTMVFKKFSWLAIYDLDGNFNFYGLLLKSALFGGVFYGFQRIETFFSDV